MSAIGSALLDLLGLTKTVDKVHTVITASQQGVEAVNAAKELLATPDGQKFKKKIIELMGGSVETPDGSIHVGVEKKPEPEAPRQQAAKGRWQYDGFADPPYVWIPEE